MKRYPCRFSYIYIFKPCSVLVFHVFNDGLLSDRANNMTLFDQDSDYHNVDTITTEAAFRDRTVDCRRRINSANTNTTMQHCKDRTDVSTGSGISRDGESSFNSLLRMDSAEFLQFENGIDVDKICEQFGESLGMSMEHEPCEEVEATPVQPAFEDQFDNTRIYTPDQDGDTLLHSAIILLQLDLVLLFISRSKSHLDICLKNKLSQTSLHLATVTEQTRVVRALMAAGADVAARDRDGNTALHIACRNGSLGIVRTLLEPVTYDEVLNNKYDIPYQEIPQDFSIANYEGYTALHEAAMNGHNDIVEFLESKGANLNQREMKTGRTILHNACINGDVKLVRNLLKYRKCNINARSYDNLTPFDMARYKKDETLCMILAAAGARYGYDEIDSD